MSFRCCSRFCTEDAVWCTAVLTSTPEAPATSMIFSLAAHQPLPIACSIASLAERRVRRGVGSTWKELTG